MKKKDGITVLKFIFGRAGSGKTTEVLNRIKNEVENGNSNLVLLVPEQTSFDYEKALLHILGDGRFTSVPVLSFTRLVDEVNRAAGGLGGTRIDDAKRTVIMSRALSATKESLSVFGKYTESVPFVRNIINTVSELKRCGINSEDIVRCRAQLGEGMLSHKLHDIDIIANVYDGMIKNTYIDPDDDMAYLAKTLSSFAYFSGKTVFVDSYKNFTGAQLRVLEQIIRQADDTVFSFCYDSAAADGMGLFANVSKTLKTIVRTAKNHNVEVDKPCVLESSFFESEELAFLERALIAENGEVYEKETKNITLCAAATLYDETDFVAREIRRIVREEGYRYRDFAIIARHDERYSAAVEHACRKYSVPCFTDKRHTIAHMPVSVFVESALSAASAFVSEDIFKYLKTELCDITFQEINMLENYVYMWNIDRADWKTEWTMSPSGFDKFDDDDAAILLKLNELRVRVVEPLLTLRRGLSGSAADICEAIWKHMDSLMLGTKLKALAKELPALDGSLLPQAYDAVIGILDSLHSALGDGECTVAEFITYFRLATENTEIGAIPQMVDEVVFGAADRIKPHEPKIVFVLGANQGEFPAQSAPNGIIGGSDRSRLLDFGLPLTDYSLGFAIDEQYLVYTTLCCPSQRLYVSYTKTDAAGKEAKPSTIVSEILKIFPTAQVLRADRESFDPQSIETPAAAFTGLLRNHDNKPLWNALYSVFADMPFYASRLNALSNSENAQSRCLSPDVSQKLFGKNMRLSATGIDTYFRCSFSYFCRYGLRAKVLKPAEIDVLQRGTIVHEVLETLIKKYGKDFRTVRDDEIKEQTDIIVEEYLARIKGIEHIRDNRFMHLVTTIKKLTVEVACHMRDDFAQSRFEPVSCELKIGGENADIEEAVIETDKGTVRIQGAIDRVDAFGAYIRVVDYKTGSRKFNLSDVLYGLNMQMLIYLYAVMQSERFKDSVPAGVLYLETGKKVGEENNFVMNGLLPSNMDLHNAMDCENNGKFVPRLRVKKDGTFYKSKDFVDEQAFPVIFAHIEKMLKSMNEALLSGNIAVNPTDEREKDACKYCDYASVCGIENRAHRKVPAMDNEIITAEMEGKQNV